MSESGAEIQIRNQIGSDFRAVGPEIRPDLITDLNLGPALAHRLAT